MKIFSFDPAEKAVEYAAQGWVHVPGGATPEFCEYVCGLISASLDEPLHGKGIGGSKEQLLLELPSDLKLRGDLLDPIACLTGLDPDRLTISERHVKMYSADAEAFPRPHKDRFASQVSLGISIEIPEGSHLVLYPEHDVEVNPLLRAGLVDSLPEERRPEQTLVGAREVTLFDKPGDVIAFHGSAMWHLRRHCASTSIVYIKCNELGSDPLSEDPRTIARRERTFTLLATEDRFLDAVPRLSAAFESVTREYGRDLTHEWLNVNVWDQPPSMISELEFELLEQSTMGRSVEAVVAEVAPGLDLRRPALDALRRLCLLGALELVVDDAR
jgi:hypothetical protein